MKWGDVRESWDRASVTAAAAASAGQLPVAAVTAFVLSLDDDSYGTGYGGAFGLACIALFLPLLLPLLGLIHACVQPLVGLSLGHAAARGVRRGPEWAWMLGAQLVPGAGWGLFSLAVGGPFVEVALWAAVSGVLPSLAVAYWRGRVARTRGGQLAPVRMRRIWVRSGLASAALCVALLGAAFLGTVTGLIKEYEPPRLSAGQLAGEWRDEDDGEVVLRLRADGRVDLALDADDPARCESTGRWTQDVDSDDGRPVVAIETDGCGGRELWTIGGTEEDPELYVTSGDPDAPEIEILVKG
ncbi:hypothetical protein ACIBKX_31450 [Streptomyces sp. NPDC050658]|uniref:hypothetical protein n=1 Tax=unclassified Streptomyces TaxID=2593676 RepID=UPI00342468E6